MSRTTSASGGSRPRACPDARAPVAFPPWLTALAWLSLGLGAATAAGIAIDILRRPPKMAVMRLVWPLCALFGHLAVLWFYLRAARGGEPGDAVAASKGALHCGAGCTLGDILAETLAALVPGVAVAFGYGTLFAREIYAIWVLDFLFAFAIGIGFQYFAIAPMRGLGPVAGLKAAVKADAASLTAWQVGMYGVMALAQFALFLPVWGRMARPDGPVFWFAMQAAMAGGFVTAWPVNLWLIRSGLKERM